MRHCFKWYLTVSGGGVFALKAWSAVNSDQIGLRFQFGFAICYKL